MRLDKLLSHTGFGSRKEVKELLKKKRVSVNDVIQKDGKLSVNEYEDSICVDGEQLIYQEFVYYMLNKPKGVISATEDPSHRTVVDLIGEGDRKKGLFPVGRLDKDTTGFLLMTTDGELAHQLLSPKKKVPKLYEAKVKGIMTEADVKTFASGMTISGAEVCLPAKLKITSVTLEEDYSEISLEIMEGKFHQVKRMVEAVGKKVVELHRVSMGGLTLDETLKPGQYRALNENEIKKLRVDY
ncbi:rRNA pseudouridine synthase [Vagococcus sp. DIV0080]|uniref:Pseudouridine synthase n=1 Tax=Candidatus Vagococcus giribetii TaxID=2230876 RepID=A0ABS3HQK5_9ENTE|nr:pseudouridine synthase [Vagococcus sp. DIV0080]MBO0476034.1 rRNA pseudouridine synthase [Vagococcus sp. DIV0080]